MFHQSSLRSRARVLKRREMYESSSTHQYLLARIYKHMNMACDEVFAVITSLPSRKEVAVNSPWTVAEKECVKEVVDACAKEQNRLRFG